MCTQMQTKHMESHFEAALGFLLPPFMFVSLHCLWAPGAIFECKWGWLM